MQPMVLTHDLLGPLTSRKSYGKRQLSALIREYSNYNRARATGSSLKSYWLYRWPNPRYVYLQQLRKLLPVELADLHRL
jgi:hypothetical protein